MNPTQEVKHHVALLEVMEELRKLKEAYDQVCQQYHLVCNITQPSRHQGANWKDCIEDSCRLQRRILE